MWIALAFLSAALLGFYDASKKYSLRGNAVLPVLFLNTLFCSLILLPFIFFSASGHIPSHSLFHVPPITPAQHWLIILKSCIVLSSWLLGYIAIKHLPLTIVGSVNATRPVLTVLGALLVFGEELNLWQWAGVILGFVSFYLMSRSGSKEGIRFTRSTAVYMLVGAALLGAASGLYDKHLLAPAPAGGAELPRMAVQAWYNIYQCLIMAVILMLLWFPKRRSSTPFKWRHSIWLISVFLSVADFVYFYALTDPHAMISVVSMVRRGSVLVSFFIGALVLREKNIRSKAIDLVFVALSMLCLYIGSN